MSFVSDDVVGWFIILMMKCTGFKFEVVAVIEVVVLMGG